MRRPRSLRLHQALAILAALLVGASSAQAMPPPQQEAARILLDQALAKYSAGDYAGAIPLCQQLLEQFPDSEWADDAQVVLGASYYSLQDYEQAIIGLGKVLTAYPNSEYRDAAQYLIGVCYYQLGDPERARNVLQALLDNYPDSKYVSQAQEMLQGLAGGATLGPVGEMNTCDALNQEGMGFYRQVEYGRALARFQAAWACYQGISDRAGEGRTLTEIGLVYKDLGQYPEALAYCQQALAIWQEIGDRVGESTTLIGIGSVYENRGQYPEALDFYQQALAIMREIGDRAGEATTLSGVGDVYDSLGQYPEALDFYQQALAITREIGDRAGEAATLSDVGDVYDSLGQYPEALNYYQQALTIRQEIGDQTGEGSTLNTIGGIYHRLGQYRQALDYYQQALAIAQKISSRVGEATTLNNIGSIYQRLGQYEKALNYCQQALAIQRKIGDKTGEGITLNNIGGVYWSLGQHQEALDYLQQALAIARESGDRAGEGLSLNNIGAIYNSLERYQEALDYYQRSLAIAQESGDQTLTGVSLTNLGAVYTDLRQYPEALKYHQEALVIFQKIGDRTEEGATLNNIGGVYDRLGQYLEGLEYYQRALVIWQEIGDRSREGTTLDHIGFTHEQQNQPQQALDYYERAMTILEEVRATVGSEAGRASFIAQYADLYDRAINLYHAQSQDEKAFFTAERGHARAFLDTMATGYVQLYDNAAADLLSREQEAYTTRQSAQDALARARTELPPDPALVADLETQFAAAEEAHAAALAAIEARHDQLAALVPGRGAVLDLAQVQALLDEKTTLLSFWVLEEQTLAFVVTRRSLHTVALPISQTDLSSHVTAFRSFPNLDAAPPESAVALYAALIAPLKEYLITPHLVIVPHNVLHYLPFAALTDGQRYLVDDYTITYLPSASVLPFIQANAGGEQGVPLILGNPTTGDFDTAVLVAERTGLGPLPFAEQEAQTIAALYGATPLLGAAATESAVREQSGQASIVHLAAHGYYNPVAPLQSLIALAPDEANDGWLTVGEVYGLDLQGADLVVLSACQSQLGELSSGDELVGLTRAFFYAGTPTVVASLWAVDDEATARLMERFYTHLQAGMGKAEALRQAQIDVRADYPNPYYWAGFVLSGEGDASVAITAPRAGTIPLWVWASGGVLLLAVFGGGVWLWFRGRRGRAR